MKQASALNRTLSTFCLLLACAVCIPGLVAQEAAKPPLQIRVTADNEEFDLNTQKFRAEGNARVTYGEIILTADTIVGDAQTGDVEASGNVEFQNGARNLRGQSFTYNFKMDKGLATDAVADADGVFFRGAELKSEPGRYILTASRFTMCNLEKPHYYLSARELLIEPGKQLVAKDVAVVFYGRRLFNVPRYRIDLADRKTRAALYLPSVGISRRSGLFAGYQFDLGHGAGTRGTFDFRLSTKQVFQGGINYDRLGGRSIVLRADYREPWYGGNVANLMVSRLPEIGIRFGPQSALDQFSSPREPLSLSRELIDPLAEDTRPGRVVFLGEAGAGRFTEEPDFIRATRYDARAMAWLDPLEVGRNSFVSPGIYGRISSYGNGDEYADLAFRLAVGRKLSETAFVSATYITHSTHGNTPFNFDHIEMTDELDLGAGFPIGEFRMEIGVRYNLQQQTVFDTDLSLSRVFHCMEPSITWKKRFREFAIGVGLVRF